ncbi:methyltransferase [Roseicyclus marinus]|uniref:methyltransferase family protein n=1 Tax=Roseicyclus marinus TaxID=2161673 RepID=UPI00240F03A0|nr:methyltransferase [Roseicyclus marinus]MDG3042483.1 methyltransferase [Roseicyclus marinus]
MLILWAALWFYRKRITIKPHHAPSALIVEGPYPVSRNPVYLGLLAILTDVAMWQGALSALPVPFVFAAIPLRRFILPEVAALFRAFGPEARRYFTTIRRPL